MTDLAFPFADLALARRVERAEGRASVAFVEARRALQPESGAAWADVGGALALFDGVGSPLTQSFGVGTLSAGDDAELDALDAFFGERGAAAAHEVTPLADPALLGRLAARGLRPAELTTVLFRPLAPGMPLPGGADPAIRVRAVGDDEAGVWAETAAAGWGETPEAAAFMRDFGRVSVRAAGTLSFLAERDGRPVATGALRLGGRVAVLAGASTVPAERGRGAQLALLAARLAHAAAAGCDLATMGALPGSGSQRNAERQGFRVAYTRIKWERPAGGG